MKRESHLWDRKTDARKFHLEVPAATSLVRLSRARTDLAPGEKKRRFARYKDVLASVLRSFDGQPEYADLLAVRSSKTLFSS